MKKLKVAFGLKAFLLLVSTSFGTSVVAAEVVDLDIWGPDLIGQTNSVEVATVTPELSVGSEVFLSQDIPITDLGFARGYIFHEGDIQKDGAETFCGVQASHVSRGEQFLKFSETAFYFQGYLESESVAEEEAQIIRKHFRRFLEKAEKEDGIVIRPENHEGRAHRYKITKVTNYLSMHEDTRVMVGYRFHLEPVADVKEQQRIEELICFRDVILDLYPGGHDLMAEYWTGERDPAVYVEALRISEAEVLKLLESRAEFEPKDFQTAQAAK